MENMRGVESKQSAKASGSGMKKIAAIILKRSKETEEMAKQTVEVAKDMKGKGAGKSSKKKRTAADIRDQSTAEKEKQKRIDKRAEEDIEEDDDLPTKAEIVASKPPSKNILIH